MLPRGMLCRSAFDLPWGVLHGCPLNLPRNVLLDRCSFDLAGSMFNLARSMFHRCPIDLPWRPVNRGSVDGRGLTVNFPLLAADFRLLPDLLSPELGGRRVVHASGLRVRDRASVDVPRDTRITSDLSIARRAVRLSPLAKFFQMGVASCVPSVISSIVGESRTSFRNSIRSVVASRPTIIDLLPQRFHVGMNGVIGLASSN